MNQIKVLSEVLVNKIAAGEVIERPSSVVKELIENAIDAKSNHIEIRIQKGGKKSIIVKDNGMGIPFQDLSLAFSSHATSKISTVEDLFHINSMGFRGEALASIGSVSRTYLVSRYKGSSEGGIVENIGGKISCLQPKASPYGTEVAVNDLFFNTPVRRKFLKSDSYEFSRIYEIVTRYALAFPEIRFDLFHNNRTVYKLPPTDDIFTRIEFFFGKNFTKNFLKLSYNKEYVTIKGLCSFPSLHHPDSSMFYFYVNKRFIKDRVIFKAVMNAYYEFLPPRRYPAVFLFINLSPREMDVNVHPTKIEIRFKNSQLVFNTVFQAIINQLQQDEIAKPLSLQENTMITSPSQQLQSILKDKDISEKEEDIKKAIMEYIESKRNQQIQGKNAEEKNIAKIRTEILMPMKTSKAFQVLNRFIIEEKEDGLYIIDQHALHERIRYYEIKTQLERDKNQKQQLLMPFLMELTKNQTIFFEPIKSYLSKLGFDIEQFGENTISIHAVPDYIANKSFYPLLTEMIEKVIQHVSEEDYVPDAFSERLTRELINTLACHSAVKAGDVLSEEEINNILLLREKYGRTDTCVHGRPTTLKLSLKELEKHFERR